jgi:hypothetical protein
MSASGAGAAGGQLRGNPNRPELDDSAEFDWPETPPGGGGDCEAGTYIGTFGCTFTDNSGFGIVIELTGPVSLTFVKSQDGEFLEITDGDFEAVANLFVGARAQIQGRLDCSSHMLDAMAVNGEWAIGDPDFPLIPGGTLEGAITGTLDPSTGTLQGQWTFGDPTFGACPGTWSVTYAP